MVHLPHLSIRSIHWPWRGAPADADELDAEALRQLDGILGEAVERLSAEHRRLIALRFARGYTVAQVAWLTGRRKSTVRLEQLHALRAFQQEIESLASRS